MKKMKLLAAAVAVMMCFGVFCACSTGTYTGTTQILGITSTVELELKSGGEFVLTSTASAGSLSGSSKLAEGTYKIDGEKITFTVMVGETASSIEGTYKNKTITFSMAGVNYELKK